MPLSLLSDDLPDDGSPTPGPGRDAAWLERIRAGDAGAFETLFRDHYHGLCVFAARLVASDAIAEELVQDVLLRVWQQRERWTVTGSVAAYLYGAVRNQALAYLRHARVERRRQDRRGAESRHTIEGHVAQADEAVRGAELAAAIDRAITDLPPRCREAYLLRRQHHLSYAEIAGVMNVTPKTVEIHIGAALKALRASLAEWLAP
jgi:RNA polymerase sigma-19 factor, ECF subfamily